MPYGISFDIISYSELTRLELLFTRIDFVNIYRFLRIKLSILIIKSRFKTFNIKKAYNLFYKILLLF